MLTLCHAPCTLQEGAGHAVLSAYVELVFDNSDGRFPVRCWGRCASDQPLISMSSLLRHACMQQRMGAGLHAAAACGHQHAAMQR